MAFTSFTISQAFLGAPLQFYPVLGSLELEELIDAFVTGSSSKADKMSEVTLDFFNNATVDLNTGALVRHYNVFSAAAATWSPTQSNSSGFSPAIYTPSPASSTAATSFGDSGYGSFSAAAQTPPAVKTNSVVTGRVSKKVKKTNEARLPGFSIMTKDGVDVTNSAGRGTKSKEQREHAHLMRIMKACDACKKKKIRCDPSHRRAQTDMSRTSTTSSSSASAANTHTSSSSSSGTSSSLPSPPTNNSSIPTFTNALDDFVLFPQEVSSWNPSFSLSDPNIPMPHDFALSDFDFDSFVASGGDGGIDFSEFSPLNQDTSFFHPEAQFQSQSQQHIHSQNHTEMAFSMPNYTQSQPAHGQEDVWNEDGGNWDNPLQTIRAQRPAISPSDGLVFQSQLQQGGSRSRSRSQSQTQQALGSRPQSQMDTQTCPLHELGEGNTHRQQRGATQLSRTTQSQLGSFPLQRFLESSSSPDSARMIATNSLHAQNRTLARQDGDIDDRWTSLSASDANMLDVSRNANTPVQDATSPLWQPQSQSHSPPAYATSPLSSGDVIHDLSQRPQPQVSSPHGPAPAVPQDSQMDVMSLATDVKASPLQTTSLTTSSFALILSLAMLAASSPFLAQSCLPALWSLFSSITIDAPHNWGYARMALSALLLSQLGSPFTSTSFNTATGLRSTLHLFTTLVFVLAGTFFASASSSGLWKTDCSNSGLMTRTGTRSDSNSEFGWSENQNQDFETGLHRSIASSSGKGNPSTGKAAASSLNMIRGNRTANAEMFGVDVGMGSGRGIVTPWVLALLREMSQGFGNHEFGVDESGDVMMDL